jgi:hypothetical protein
MTMPRAAFTIAGLALLTALLAGCQGYAPVDHGGAPTRLALAPVINESGPPQLIAPLSRNLREQLAHAPGWRLVSEASADPVLRLRILSLQREAVSRDPADTGRPLSYYETLRVAVQWDGPGQPPWGPDPVRHVEADTLLYAQPGLIAAEGAAMAGLADDLARKILALLNRPVAPAQP